MPPPAQAIPQTSPHRNAGLTPPTGARQHRLARLRRVYHHPGDDHPDTLAISAAAKDFFLGHPLDVIEGQGDYGGPYEFTFDFAIALDAKNGLIFSFVWNLQA